MLPSGNDAATVLGENFGAFIYYERLGEKSLLESIHFYKIDVKSLDVTEDTWNLKIKFVTLCKSDEFDSKIIENKINNI